MCSNQALIAYEQVFAVVILIDGMAVFMILKLTLYQLIFRQQRLQAQQPQALQQLCPHWG
jgi:hypothetical protein